MVYEKVASLIEQIESGKEPDPADIAKLADQGVTRRALHEALKSFDRKDLFPKQYMTMQAAAEADIS